VGWGAGRPCRPPCRPSGRAVSWARPVAHALHWPSCRAGTGTVPAVPCRPAHGPCQKAMLRAVPPAHGPSGNL